MSMSYCGNCEEVTDHVTMPHTDTLQCKQCGEYHELQTVPVSDGATHAEELNNDKLIDSATELLASLEECLGELERCGDSEPTHVMIRARLLIDEVTT